MKKSPKPYIQHIIDAADTTKRLLEGYDYDEFLSDDRTQLAIVKLIEIIGEASIHLLKDYQDQYPKIPRHSIRGMRNRLIHEYWDIDLPTVWKTATKRVPQLKQDLLPILSDLESQDPQS